MHSTLTLCHILGNVTQSFPFRNQQKTTTLTQNINQYHFNTHFQNTRENIITIQTENILVISHEYGFKHKHLTNTTLHNIYYQIKNGFNYPRPLQRTVVVALDISKAVDTVNIHKLIQKLTLTNISNTIIKCITN